MAWGWVPSPSREGSALDPIPGSWVALGFVRTRSQILTVLLLPAPGERQAFLLKGPSGAEPFGRWLLCLSAAPAKPPILEPVPPAGGLDGCEELQVAKALEQPDQVGASHGQMSRRPPQHRHGPQLLPICRMGLRRPCQS